MAKRTHDSNDQDSSKATKTSRKSLDATCVICGDRAIGFNYDVLSCASCKAFFRRNAQKDKVCVTVAFLRISMLVCNFLGTISMFDRSRSMFYCANGYTEMPEMSIGTVFCRGNEKRFSTD